MYPSSNVRPATTWGGITRQCWVHAHAGGRNSARWPPDRSKPTQNSTKRRMLNLPMFAVVDETSPSDSGGVYYVVVAPIILHDASGQI